jgi:2-polyprenyl-3-methyl-5-hydroxy-6-metoxy-1,4-benzoquinol methylase
MDYRAQLYERYHTGFRGEPLVFNSKEALRWGRCYRRHMRGWLPGDHTAKILDAACGDGKFLYFLLSEGYGRVEGVDISPEQVTVARQASLQVAQDDVFHYLSGKHEEYSIIIAMDLLEHFEKEAIIPFFEACHAALIPGGRLIIQTPNAASPFFGAVRYGDPTHQHCLTPRLLGQLLRMAGFGNYEARDMRPVARGVVSYLRIAIWLVIRRGLWLWDLAETGCSDGVYTRVFLASAERPLQCQDKDNAKRGTT